MMTPSRCTLRVSLAAVLALGLVGGAFAQSRTVVPLEQDWRFLQGDPEEAETLAFDHAGWKRVSVPHDWVIAGPVDPKARGGGSQGWFPTGVAWYRRELDIRPQPGRRWFVELDGVMERSGVWINGHHLGHRPYGYMSQRYDLTPFLRADGRNVLAVRADTSNAPSSRWYAGGGINRKARLISTGDLFIEQGGAFVSTPSITDAAATVRVQVDVTNAGPRPRDARLQVVLTDPSGRDAARIDTVATTVAVGRTEVLQGEATLTRPRRWDISDPALYQAHVRVLDADGAALDEERVRFGVRVAEFRSDTGFWLNGRNHKLKGVALHEDGGAVGAAAPLGVWRDRLITLKRLGVNAVRTAHNPPDPGFLDLTDELGLVVMDEFFDQWNVAKNPHDYHLFFGDWHKKDVRDIVRRDRNHPSIVIWSAGNEIHDTAYPVQAKAALKSILDVAHANDPTRPVTLALFRPNVTGDYHNGLADMLDVVGQNYRENELIAAHQQNPERKIVGTENGRSRSNWLPVRDYPAFAGMFLWTGVDYLGEADRSGWPNIGAPSGLVDRAGFVKIGGLERAGWWSETPVVHVVRNSSPPAPPTPPPAPGAPPMPVTIQVATPQPRQQLFDDWTPEDPAPHPEIIEVYSNCASVEVMLNGRSLGAKPLPADASPRQWPVTFQPGTVVATCRDGDRAGPSDSLRTAGPPTQIVLESAADAVGSGFDDIAFVRARVADARGVTVPRMDTALQFRVSGAGVLVATDNGSITDHTPFASAARKAVDGKAVALVRGAGQGRLRVGAAAPGLKPGVLTLTARP